MNVQFPSKLRFVFNPARFKVLHGGRDGGKSWGVARALLEIGASRKLLILCSRELMKSISDSVHRLLSNQIENLGLQGFYEIQKTTIKGRNGTEFIFAGLKHNIDNIKSLESVDIVWVEEAANVSKGSWDKLIPTVRKNGSEIWVTFNPELDSDDTYQRFVVSPPPGAVVVKILYSDNPWASAVLEPEREALKLKDEESHAHIWLGHCKSTVEGAIYATELRLAENEGRITKVPWEPQFQVHTAWDLGWGDSTTCWMFQVIAQEFRFIDYLEGTGRDIGSYLKDLKERPYGWGADYMPWDAASTGQLATGKSIEQIMRASGRKHVVVVKQNLVHVGIDAARRLMPKCWFDIEQCADGVQALRHYRYGTIAALGTPTREPLHDWASHPADGFRSFAMGVGQESHGVLDWYKLEGQQLAVEAKKVNQDLPPAPNGECPKCGSASVSTSGAVMVGDKLGEGKRCGQCGHGWSVAK